MTLFHAERNEGLRLYVFSWVPLILLATLLAACLIMSKFSIRIDSLMLSAVLTGPLLTVAGLGLVSGRRTWGWRFGFVMLAIAQFSFLGSFAGPLSYIAAAADLPLQDTNFARLDRLLGLDWPAYYRFAMAWPGLLPYAYLSYAAILVPCLGVPLVLGLMGHFVRLQQFVMATILTTAVDVAVSSALPAIGTYGEFALPAQVGDFKATGYLVQLEILPVLRAGGLRVLDLANLGGIITFPSLHAAASILAIWGFWAVWWLRPAALIVYIGMLLATPLMGGHYFVDIIAGIGVAVLAVAAAKRLSPSSPEAARAAPENFRPSALPAGENCDAAALFVAERYIEGANSAAGIAGARRSETSGYRKAAGTAQVLQKRHDGQITSTLQNRVKI